MTDVSAWLIGMVCWSAPFLLFYLIRTLWGQVTAGPIIWRDSNPMRLVISVGLLITGVTVWGVAAVIAPTIEPVGLTTRLVWTALSLIWIAEIIALSAIGRLSPTVCVCSLWTLYTIATRFQ